MTFKKAMTVKCGECKSRAGHHRMTKSGRFYCLNLNSRGKKMRDTRIENGMYWDLASIHHLKVKYLQRSDIPITVGETIIRGLTEMEESHVE